MTIIELIVSFALATTAGVLLWSITNLIWGGQRATESSYLVSGETERAIEWIRRDVNESALAAIEVFPNSEHENEAPGMSLVSNRAYDPELRAKPLINRWGAPQWDKHVFYTLQGGSGGRTGNLIRWEKELAQKNFLPASASLLPSALEPAKKRVLVRDVLLPNTTVSEAGPGGSLVTDGFGGFRVQFIRRSGGSGGPESLTTVNPRKGASADNTRMLEAEFKLLQSDRSRPHVYTITFRMASFH